VNLEEHVFRNVINAPIAESDNNLSTFLWWSISRQTCIYVFSVITLIIIIISAIRSVLFVSVRMKASLNLHNNMFNALIKAKIYFFNTNPSGNYNFEWL
jgi:ATP-binding cassette, subfamily C (CFTR/MRP), member 4